MPAHSRNLKLFLYFLVASLNLTVLAHLAIAEHEYERGSSIYVDENSLKGTFGVYQETELILPGAQEPVQWSLDDTDEPPGLQLQNSIDGKAIILGTPQFTDEWCTLITAIDAVGRRGARDICFFAYQNSALQIPYLMGNRELPHAKENSSYITKIIADVPPAVFSNFTTQLHKGSIPNGFNILTLPFEHAVQLTAFPQFQETFRFSLITRDLTTQQVSYKQFQLTVESKDIEAPIYSCPPGYYYDSFLGYCAPSRPITCPNGSYYEPSVGNCVSYPLPPPEITCGYNQYFDHFLGECVYFEQPRCPWNYHYSAWENRCVRNFNHCPIGTRYNYFERTCEPIWRNERCGYNEHWDAYERRCEYNGGCLPGYFWDRHQRRCESYSELIRCHSDEFYNPRTNHCERRWEYCRPGFDRDYITGHCRDNRPRYYCGPGQHWSYRENRCVDNFCQPPRRPTPIPPPPPRPPVVIRPPSRPQPPPSRPPVVNPPSRPQPPPSRPPVVEPPSRPQPPPSRPPVVEPPSRPQPPPSRPPVVNPPSRPQPPPSRPPVVNPPSRPQPPPSRPGGGGGGGNPTRPCPPGRRC